MYIFELLYKAFHQNKLEYKSKFNYMQNFEQDDSECNHLFMPIDSSNEIFACKYCGLVVKKEDFKD